jgi:hypothetical protein
MNDQPSFASSGVPQGHLIIARHFSAGNIAVTPQVPEGRQNFLKSQISNLKSRPSSFRPVKSFAYLAYFAVKSLRAFELETAPPLLEKSVFHLRSSVAKTLCLCGKKEPFNLTQPAAARLN